MSRYINFASMLAVYVTFSKSNQVPVPTKKVLL